MRWSSRLHPFLVSVALEALTRKIKRKKKGIQIRKVLKLSLFTDDILSTRDPKNSTRNLETINSFSELAGHKITI